MTKLTLSRKVRGTLIGVLGITAISQVPANSGLQFQFAMVFVAFAFYAWLAHEGQNALRIMVATVAWVISTQIAFASLHVSGIHSQSTLAWGLAAISASLAIFVALEDNRNTIYLSI